MTARALDQLKQYRNELTTLSANRDAVIDDIVQAIMHASNITGQSINILIKSAGISRQTYYLRAKDQAIVAADPSTSDPETDGSLEKITRLADKLAQQDKDLTDIKERRAKIIVDFSSAHTATDLAEVAGVTAVWVRALRREAIARKGDAG